MSDYKKEQLFQLINNFFDHTYLITIQKCTDRHTFFKRSLEGLDYELFWGVDGDDLSIEQVIEKGEYDPQLAMTKNWRGLKLVPGEIGCAMSHLRVYQDILQKGYEKVLILEDDVMVLTSHMSQLKSGLDELPNDWDVFYLGCRNNRAKITIPALFKVWITHPLLSKLGFSRYDPRKLRLMYAQSYSNNLMRAGWHFGTYAYAVSSKGAEKIINYQTPIVLQADNAIGMACAQEVIKAYRLRKLIFQENSKFPTTIEGRKGESS